ncbi:MAG: general secretion pathway protein [Betaproteobacteria bacterium]|nr:general secretion pathway protein [Betaproteobacteria bacterium]
MVLLGLTLAYWTWSWFAPRAEPRVQAAAEPAGNAASASGLFGRVPRNRNAAAPTGMAIKLLGLVTSSRSESGYAVVQLEAKENRAVREGADVAPGIRLAEVHADHIILERNGVRETLAWPEKPKIAVSPATPPAAPPAASRARKSSE